MPASIPSSGMSIDGKVIAGGYDGGGFTDFQDADPLKSTDDFSDFQQAPGSAPQQTNGSLMGSSGINM